MYGCQDHSFAVFSKDLLYNPNPKSLTTCESNGIRISAVCLIIVRILTLKYPLLPSIAMQLVHTHSAISKEITEKEEEENVTMRREQEMGRGSGMKDVMVAMMQ